MAAKLLHSLTDDNPDLQNQMGCMTGIIQLFDRHHILAGRHISGRTPKRLPPSGSSRISNGTSETGPYSIYHQQRPKEKSSYKNVCEKQRVSTESSRASFSSSRSSSFSSIDCNRTAQLESSSFDQIIFPETPSTEPTMNQSSASPQFGRQSLDLRDVVKDSMYREIQGLSVKSTVKEVAAQHVVKHRDSPRPLQLSKSPDGAHILGTNEKQNLPADLKESLRVLAKLQETPWYFSEAKERSRLSYESKEGTLFSVPKDAPRFSYDGREMNRMSFESRDGFKKSTSLRELPRLSLDGREGSMRGFNSDSKSHLPSRNAQDSGNSNNWVKSPQQVSGSQTRGPSVVAKLMGLEALPGSRVASDSQLGLTKTCVTEDSKSFARSSQSTDPGRSIPKSKSSRNSWREPTSPHWKNPDPVAKPVSRFPIEPLPWKQLDRSRGSQKPAHGHPKDPVMRSTSSYSSVYDEIEKRLKDLEFTQSGKDLRALKQILEAMQAKGLLETRAEEQDSNFDNQQNYELQHMGADHNVRAVNQRKPQGDRFTSSTNRRNDFLRTHDSPIVIMKPAKLVRNSGIHASSVIPVDGLSGLPKLRGGDLVDNRKCSNNGRTAKDYIPKTSSRENHVNSTDKRNNSRNFKSSQTLTRPQQLSKENTTSLVKSSGSVSPRLQQKRLELETQSRPPTPPSDSIKSRRQSIKQQPDSDSPGGKRRPKSSKLHQSDESSNEIRTMSYQEDDISLHSESNNTLESKIDIEVTSADQSAEINGSQSPSVKPAKKKSTPRLTEDGSLTEIATVGVEHHSPVSVLDDAVYRDDVLSPVKQIPTKIKDDGTQNSNNDSSKEPWVPAVNLLTNSSGSGLSSEINRKKLQNIDDLVQKLRSLNSSHDEARTDYIASLCEDTNPDHRYISEILLASGLLLRDLGSSLTTFQLHSSGHPINPELFLVLEQTRGSTSLRDECSAEKVANSTPDQEKFHRKLIFDSVNEILVGKLALVGASPEPWLRPNKVARKTLNAQKLLKELCSEIENLQANKSECNADDKEDGLKSILSKDVMHQSESWTDLCGEFSGVVLDIERRIFKDLVGEIVISEAAALQAKPGRRCRQLFGK